MDSFGGVRQGVLWFMFNSAFAKAIALGGQWVLGIYLSPGDFAAYALAITVASLVAATKNGGVYEVVVQHQTSDANSLSTALYFAIAFNSAGCLFLLILASPVSRIFALPDAAPILMAAGIAFIVGTPAFLYRAQLSKEHKFKEVALAGAQTAILRNIALILLAWSGAGPLSFVLPLVLEAAAEPLLLRRYLTRRTSLSWPSTVGFGPLWQKTRWIILSSVALSIASNGDYMALALFGDSTSLGNYFFAFQLVLALGVVFNQAFEAVLFPVLSQFSSDSARLSKALLKCIQIISLTLIPLWLVFAASAPFLIDLLWSGKWINSSLAAQMLSLSLPTWLFFSVTRSLVDSKGLWRLRLQIFSWYAMGSFLVPASICLLIGADSVAAGVAVFRTIFCIGVTIYVAKLINLSARRILHGIGFPVILAALSWIVASFFTGVPLSESMNVSSIDKLASLVVSFLLAYFALALAFRHSTLRELFRSSAIPNEKLKTSSHPKE